jgi:hypothetical protein
MMKSNLISQIADFNDRLFTPYNGLRVAWFDSWRPALDEALKSLPEIDSCPHELFRLLIQNPCPARKRSALVTKRGEPVALIGLRQRNRYSWEPLTQWIVPGVVFPAKSGYLMPALEAVRREVWVAWWRMGRPPVPSPLIRYLESTPTYRAHLSDDFEQYWRENGYFKTIRRIRNRCRGFTIAVNSPRSADWTIRNWEAKWREDPTTPDPGLLDRLVAANYLENHGRHYTIRLLDQGIPIGGATMTVHHKDLVAGVLYREPSYNRYGIGDRLIDLSFSFAEENGFETFDIGGRHEYKKHWARQEGRHWLFYICPEPLLRVKQLAKWIRKLRKIGANAGEN